ncbi:diaminopimelate epimerase [Nocardioides rotundus]|uniref:diaminopimelate epimerase n=1 Tax=Nocardioides rotundus TaxID=1774216 RepID=UPI001CC05EF4|nr:diaminopimelate epimerase [Nocardioides rotundus]UAL30480.1 diaminopimelate epimerase [Nocardioides rotundus]
MTYSFLKGHGTENDFVLLPDHDGEVHGELTPQRVAALCDRRAGIGGDGVLRVIRTRALGEQQDAEWFMDYRNSDGSLSEMCGNGIRLFARHLVDEGLATSPVRIGTRDGVKVVTVEGDRITADLGVPRAYDDTEVAVGDRRWPAQHLDMGNPHAVAFVDDLDDAGDLLRAPEHDQDAYPHGVNVEFVVRRGPRHVAMRVHERGSGETRSCGTGACAVMVASALADGAGERGADGALTPPEAELTYRVDVPGGELAVTWTPDNHVLLTGPALVVARGETDL